MSGWVEAGAPAKLNLALVVGPLRSDGKHEVVTVLERLALVDTVCLREAAATSVTGFEDDTLVRAALEAVCAAAASDRRFAARLEKRIPVAAGLGGGSSDAAASLELANRLLGAPLSPSELHALACSLGADVPFFLRDGAQLATGDGTILEPLALPRDYTVLLALPDGARKSSTAEVYRRFDARAGADGFADRRDGLRAALAALRTPADLARLPANDLASSPLAGEVTALGALRADVSGAGPIVYGIFTDERDATRAADSLAGRATTWITTPAPPAGGEGLASR